MKSKHFAITVLSLMSLNAFAAGAQGSVDTKSASPVYSLPEASQSPHKPNSKQLAMLLGANNDTTSPQANIQGTNATGDSQTMVVDEGGNLKMVDAPKSPAAQPPVNGQLPSQPGAVMPNQMQAVPVQQGAAPVTQPNGSISNMNPAPPAMNPNAAAPMQPMQSAPGQMAAPAASQPAPAVATPAAPAAPMSAPQAAPMGEQPAATTETKQTTTTTTTTVGEPDSSAPMPVAPAPKQ